MIFIERDGEKKTFSIAGRACKFRFHIENLNFKVSRTWMGKDISSEALIDTSDINISKKISTKKWETGSRGSGKGKAERMSQAQGSVCRPGGSSSYSNRHLLWMWNGKQGLSH